MNQFTVKKFQLIAVEYTGLKFTKGALNPKPKALEEGGELQNLHLQILSNIGKKIIIIYSNIYHSALTQQQILMTS